MTDLDKLRARWAREDAAAKEGFFTMIWQLVKMMLWASLTGRK